MLVKMVVQRGIPLWSVPHLTGYILMYITVQERGCFVKDIFNDFTTRVHFFVVFLMCGTLCVVIRSVEEQIIDQYGRPCYTGIDHTGLIGGQWRIFT